MKSNLFIFFRSLLMSAVLVLLGSCSLEDSGNISSESDHDTPPAEYARGPHGGRILKNGDFVLELSIFETGVPPEFRAWASSAGKPIHPKDVNLEVRLIRLGNIENQIGFQPEDDFLRGDQVIYEPHSFVVSIDARVDGTSHHWEYDSFEGRTQIGDAIAEAFELETEIAGPARIRQVIEVYGRVEPNAERVSAVSARFEGLIQSVDASLGDAVKAGQSMLTIESNESLKPYQIKAPISGTVTERNANVGEPTAGRRLFTIIDPSSVWVNLAIFPADLQQVRTGAPVKVFQANGKGTITGVIDRVNIVADSNQAVMARVTLDNTEGQFFPGSYVRAQIMVAEYDIPLAVKRVGLQSFRDFTVVFAKVGEEYEVRMLELGRQDDEWVEVLGGLDAGARYVTSNSYLIKADIEKSGASHDH